MNNNSNIVKLSLIAYYIVVGFVFVPTFNLYLVNTLFDTASVKIMSFKSLVLMNFAFFAPLIAMRVLFGIVSSITDSVTRHDDDNQTE